jgi:hypothetical protein
MLHYDWSAEKNAKLKEERGISFEDVVEAIGADGLLDVLPHPDQQKYLGQNIYVVSALGYVYLVPYVTDNERIFLKTIIPSRRAKKIYQES